MWETNAGFGRIAWFGNISPFAAKANPAAVSPLCEGDIMPIKKILPFRFVLTGFSHDQEFREFTFEGIDEDYGRTPFTVRASLTLARSYGIHFQDLPLLCREFLERRAVTEDASRLTFTEEDMRVHQEDRKAVQLAAAQKRRAPTRQPSSGNTGNAWRTAPRTVNEECEGSNRCP